MNYLKRIYLQQQFYPTLLGYLINPFFFARKGLLINISSLSGKISGLTLDIGCGTQPYRRLFSSSEYWGLEIDTPENRERKNADFFYDGKTFPFDESKFDSLIANQVFEHVFNPDEFLNEMNRVLKVGGKALITVPFVWDEHEQPHDFARYSSFGLKAILEKHGFEVLEQRKSVDDIRVIFQLLNAYIYKKTLSKSALLNLFTCVILIAPFNIIGQVLSKITPRNPDLYLDNIILATKTRAT